MKGHKAHHHAKRKAHGGDIESPMKGTDEAAMDLRTKPEPRTNAKHIDDEAEEMHAKKHGGRTKRKHGGHVHHEHGKHLAHAKHVGHVHGEHHTAHAGRKPRKSGGRAGSEANPFTSALHGTPPKGHKVEKETMGMDK
jgi:hypothetical protein